MMMDVSDLIASFRSPPDDTEEIAALTPSILYFDSASNDCNCHYRSFSHLTILPSGTQSTGDVFVCQFCGRVHVCRPLNGGCCSESMISTRQECLVCPISGRTYMASQIRSEEKELSDAEDAMQLQYAPRRRGKNFVHVHLPRNRRQSRLGRRVPSHLEQDHSTHAQQIVDLLVIHTYKQMFQSRLAQKMCDAEKRCIAYAQHERSLHQPVNIVHQIRTYASIVFPYAMIQEPNDPRGRISTYVTTLLLSSWDHFVKDIFIRQCRGTVTAELNFRRIGLATLYYMKTGLTYKAELPQSHEQRLFEIIPICRCAVFLPPENLIHIFVPQSRINTISQRNLSLGRKVFMTILFTFVTMLTNKNIGDEEFLIEMERLRFWLPGEEEGSISDDESPTANSP